MDTQQESLGFLLADVTRLMRNAFHQRIKSQGLTLAQARALTRVSRNQGLRQVELAEQLEIKPITLARLIDQLARHGVVERRPDPADRRAYRLYLTAGAKPYLTAIEQVVGQLRDEALRGLSQEQSELVFVALRKMRGNLASM